MLKKKYKFEKVVFGVDSIAKNSKGNNITGLIEKKTKKGKELGQYENGKKNGITYCSFCGFYEC